MSKYFLGSQVYIKIDIQVIQSFLSVETVVFAFALDEGYCMKRHENMLTGARNTYLMV